MYVYIYIYVYTVHISLIDVKLIKPVDHYWEYTSYVGFFLHPVTTKDWSIIHQLAFAELQALPAEGSLIDLALAARWSYDDERKHNTAGKKGNDMYLWNFMNITSLFYIYIYISISYHVMSMSCRTTKQLWIILQQLDPSFRTREERPRGFARRADQKTPAPKWPGWVWVK